MQQMSPCPSCGSTNPLGQRFCGACGARVIATCPYCQATVDPKRRFCPNCGADLFGGKQQQTTGSARGTEAPVAGMPVQNTSGQGKAAIVPSEIKEWNWGAFLLTPIWGISNRIWKTLLLLIPVPFVPLVISCVFGAKGNEWEWKKKRWDSIEHFRRTQRTWRNWGIGVTVAPIILYAVLLLCTVLFAGGL